ncbi:MAG: hypothetical protein WC325_05715 [Candidatus Bathyarchaeia archaeon]
MSLGIETVDSLFPGFSLGDFAVIHGSHTVQYQLGGLKTNVLFVDGSNIFRLYDITDIAQTWELDPKQVLERIFVSRAFTAYQLVSIILEQLQTAIKKFDSKVVIISNLSQLFLDKDIPKKEAETIFSQLTDYLSDFAQKNQVILIVTHRPYAWSKRTKYFKHALCNSANVVLSIKKSNQIPHFALEKHPYLQLGKTELPSNECNLLDFIEV